MTNPQEQQYTETIKQAQGTATLTALERRSPGPFSRRSTRCFGLAAAA